MADLNDGVAPETQTDKAEDSGLVSFGDIAEAAGVESSFFESAVQDTEEAEEVSEVEEVEEAEDLTEIEPTEIEEPIKEESKQEDSEGVKKRIGKLIEAKKLAEEEANELREKLAEMESATQSAPDPKGMERFDKVNDYKELQAREAEAEHLREWLLENPDGGEYTDISGTDHEVDYEAARKLMVETDRDLRKNIPLAAQRLQQRENNKQTAMQTFEWMKDKTSPEMLEVQKVLETNSFIKDYYEKDPYSVLTVAYAIEGIKAVNARKVKKPIAQAAAPKAPVPSRASASVVRKKTNSKKSLLQQATSGSVEDAASYIESIL